MKPQSPQQAPVEFGGDMLGGAGEEGLGEVLGERGGYGGGYGGMGGGYWEGTSWQLADKIIQTRINIGK